MLTFSDSLRVMKAKITDSMFLCSFLGKCDISLLFVFSISMMSSPTIVLVKSRKP